MTTTRFSTFGLENLPSHYTENYKDYIGEATRVYGKPSDDARFNDYNCSSTNQFHSTTLNHRQIEEYPASVISTQTLIHQAIQHFQTLTNEVECLKILETLHLLSKTALNQHSGNNLVQIASFLHHIVFGLGLQENCNLNEKIALKQSIHSAHKISPEILRRIVKVDSNITPAIYSKAWEILNSLFPQNKQVDCIMKFYPSITLQRLLQ